MNYNPYFFPPNMPQAPMKVGIFGNLAKKGTSINWSGILGGTQKALNIANQAIPIIKQMSPVMQNAKTMFKVMNEFKKVDTSTATVENNISTNENIVDNIDVKNEKISSEGPTFFI